MKSICKFCYYQIRNIGLICKYKKDETYKTLAQVLIISQLDCDNALLYILSQKPPTANAELCCMSSDVH